MIYIMPNINWMYPYVIVVVFLFLGNEVLFLSIIFDEILNRLFVNLF